MEEIWFTIDEYRQEKLNKRILGQIIVNVLVDSGYILQLDYKESVEYYMDDIVDFWNTNDVKIVRFEMGNDQNYYAKIPRDSNIKRIYEIDLIDMNAET